MGLFENVGELLHGASKLFSIDSIYHAFDVPPWIVVTAFRQQPLADILQEPHGAKVTVPS